jgi:enoyl-CoA hydratase/carnithine racemase
MTEDAERREYVHVSFPAGDPPLPGVALVTLDRREALNALSYALVAQLDAALAALDADRDCHAIVIAGVGSRAFAAGADVQELSTETPDSLHGADPFAVIDRVALLATPTIAAVRGFALGGGCELAMDKNDGTEAFLTKRPPVTKGR